MIKHILIATLFISVSAQADFYEQKQGNVTVFSDQPEQGGQKIELPKESGFQETRTNQIPPKDTSQAEQTASDNANSDAQTKEPYRKILFSNIQEQQTFHNERRIPVNITLNPKLQEGDKVRLIVDGKIYSEQDYTGFTLDNLPRGNHILQAVVIGSDGSSLSTGKLQIHVKYHSQLFNRPKV